ncbi:MAG: transporter substrate-binding domain-containing protein, partial [Emcibacteraceae bacterium]|nr:transporter substrate-binding domain-containing protein [Emcibacteraceae bacterium]
MDFLNLVADKAGFQVEYVSNKPWEELQELTKNKEIDIIHSLIQTDVRYEFLNFTTPYLDLPLYTFGHSEVGMISTLDDFKGKRVAVLKGWAVSKMIRETHPEIILVEFDNILDILRALSAQKIDVFTGSIFTIDYYKTKYFIPNINIVGDNILFAPQTTVFHRLASHVDNPILNNILQKGVDAVSREEFIEISRKWTSSFQAENTFGLTQEELQWLSENKIIKVASDIDVAPVAFIDENGKIVGIVGEFLNTIASNLNVQFEWAKNKNFPEGIEMPKSGDAHMISSVTPNARRSEEFHLTENYLIASHMI